MSLVTDPKPIADASTRAHTTWLDRLLDGLPDRVQFLLRECPSRLRRDIADEALRENRDWPGGGPALREDHALLLTQLGRYDEAISKEFTLVSDRMVWFVTSESFIFGAFAAVAGYYETNTDKHLRLLSVLRVTLPLLGVVMAAAVIPAISAAHQAAHLLKHRRARLEARLAPHLRATPVTTSAQQHRRGNLPSGLLPYVILAAWVVLLVVMAWLWLHPEPKALELWT